MEKYIKANRKIFLAVSVFVVLLLSFLLYLVNPGFFGVIGYSINTNNVVHVQEIPVIFEVTDKKIIGINVDVDALKLGTVMKGNFVERKVTIVNPFSFNINVLISFSEDVNDFVNISSSDFVLGFNESRTLVVVLEPVDDTPNGNYSGTMKVVMKRI